MTEIESPLELAAAALAVEVLATWIVDKAPEQWLLDEDYREGASEAGEAIRDLCAAVADGAGRGAMLPSGSLDPACVARRAQDFLPERFRSLVELEED